MQAIACDAPDADPCVEKLQLARSRLAEVVGSTLSEPGQPAGPHNAIVSE